MKMNWLEWLKAEGYWNESDTATQQAMQKLLAAQKEFDPGLQRMISDARLQKLTPCPIGLMVEAVCRLGIQCHYETEVVAAALLHQLRLQEARIAALEKRNPPRRLE